jgi:hypothetical protein
MNVSKRERLRRLLLGDLRRLLRHRYGHTLPDDDAGQEDLDLLLYAISLDPVAPAEKMNHQIETIAPWMDVDWTEENIEDYMYLALGERRLSAQQIGERLQLTNAERERLSLWRIAPVDMTEQQLAEQRKAKDRARARKRYKRTRADFLAASLTASKPWEAEGISRTTWYDRRAKGRTGASEARLTMARTDLSGRMDREKEGEKDKDRKRDPANENERAKRGRTASTTDGPVRMSTGPVSVDHFGNPLWPDSQMEQAHGRDQDQA